MSDTAPETPETQAPEATEAQTPEVFGLRATTRVANVPADVVNTGHGVLGDLASRSADRHARKAAEARESAERHAAAQTLHAARIAEIRRLEQVEAEANRVADEALQGRLTTIQNENNEALEAKQTQITEATATVERLRQELAAAEANVVTLNNEYSQLGSAGQQTLATARREAETARGERRQQTAKAVKAARAATSFGDAEAAAPAAAAAAPSAPEREGL